MTATSDKKATKREKWNRPVSKKFYDFIHYQIRCARYVSEEVRVDLMMNRFDEYIEKGTVEVDFNNIEHVVFTMLQPYIDQAVDRSRRAREAAARRREARQSVSMESSTPSSASIEESAPEDTPTENATPQEASSMTREEKRARRREQIRLRRQQKHAKRIQSRQTTITDKPDAPPS